MANPHPDAVDVVKPVASLTDTPIVPPITPADNTRVMQFRSANSQALRDSGILPELSIADEYEFMYKNFGNLDKSKDGHITKREIDDYVKSGNPLKPEEGASLTRIRDRVDRLEELHNDENGDENDGITRGDLRVASENAHAMDYARGNFGRLDGNHDGHVTEDELDSYAKARGDKLSSEELVNIKVLKKNMSDLEEFSNDENGDENSGFTRNDLMEGKKELGIDGPSGGEGGGKNSDPFSDLRPALAYAQKNFEKLDADRDGYISEDEIDAYGDSNELTSDEMQNLKALKEKVHNVEEESNDESGVENNGISKKDIVAANAQIANLAYAQKVFNKVDGNGDGHVTADEIEGYITAMAKDLPVDEVRRLEALKKQVGDLQEKHNDESGDENDGFTPYDLTDAMDELGSAGVKDGEPVREAPQATDEEPPIPAFDQPETDKVKPEPGEEGKTHTVVRGDSLWRICKGELRQRSGGTEPTNADILKMVKEMARLNNMPLEKIIRPGDVLKVPGATPEN